MARRVAYIQYTDPAYYPPLEHSSRILADEGWKVFFLGVQNPDFALRFPHHPEIVVKCLPHTEPGWRQKVHFIGYCLWAIAYALRWHAKWIYASDPLSCPAALVASYLPGLRVIYHEHDSPEKGPASAFMRFILWARRRLARRARLCVLPNEARTERFTRVTHREKQTLTVWNCPSIEEVAGPRSPSGRGDLWIVYHGTLVPPRLPMTVLQSLAELPERVKLRVIGYETIGHRGYLQQLRTEAERLGLSDRVDFLGPMPRRPLLDWSRRSDVGLALLPTDNPSWNERTMTGASNKPFDYLACGLALLVSDLPGWREMVVEPGYGLACDPENPASIASALRWFLEHPAEMRSMGELGRQRIADDWNYERQFLPVAEVMHQDAG